MSSFDSLLGATLKSATGEIPTSEALKGKVVGLYFSAHWCPPCRGFTPKLADAYKKYKSLGKNLEIVFVSSDRDEKSFDEYFAEQPWLALPYSNRDAKNALSKKYKVSGIPTFVILDEEQNLITKDGRSEITSDPEAARFPWKPKPLSEILPTEFQGKEGTVSASSLDAKYLGLYFSAHWCPPCRGFTPKLAQFYKDLKAGNGCTARDDFEMVFVSSDRDEKAFDGYYAEHPWLALPYAQREAKDALSKYFEVSGIPSFVILGPVGADGTRPTITTSARAGVEKRDFEAFPFYPQPVEELSDTVECNGSDVNETASLIVLCENQDDSEQADIKKAVLTVAKEVADKAKAASADPAQIFFYATSGSGPVGQVRKLCGLEKATEDPVMLLLDIPDDGAYYVSKETDVTAESIRAFIASPGEKQQLQK